MRTPKSLFNDSLPPYIKSGVCVVYSSKGIAELVSGVMGSISPVRRAYIQIQPAAFRSKQQNIHLSSKTNMWLLESYYLCVCVFCWGSVIQCSGMFVSSRCMYVNQYVNDNSKQNFLCFMFSAAKNDKFLASHIFVLDLEAFYVAIKFRVQLK